jgi:cytochrome P450
MELRPYSGTYLIDPAATWQHLLDQPEGVQYAEDLGLWVISTHALVHQALGDPETFLNAMTLLPVYEVCPEALPVIMQIDAPPTTAAADAPTHARTRRALRATFANTAARVDEQYGPIVRRRVDELVGRLSGQRGQSVDLVAEFTAVLPLLVITDLLGVPDRDVPRIKAWADGQIALVWGCPSPAEQVRLAQGLLDFWRYCQQMVRDRAAGEPGGGIGRDAKVGGGDYVSVALRYRDGRDDVLTLDEVASLAFNLLVAGHETTSGLLAHGLDQALSTPDTWAGFAADPAGVPAFVEEVLRMRPPIDGWLRLTARAVTLDGVEIPAGARCLLLIGAANRDRAAFADPHRFDPQRADGRDQLTFGYGPHFCIGAALARLEARIALTRLAAALPGLRLAPEHTSRYHPNVAFRAHRTLPAIVDIAPPAPARHEQTPALAR